MYNEEQSNIKLYEEFNNKLANTPLLDNNRLFLNNTGKQTNS